MAGFTEHVARLNAVGDKAPGFVWRFKPAGSDDATGVTVFDDPRIVYNCSVWRTIEELFRFCYCTEHKDFIARTREWFIPPPKAPNVLWYTDSRPCLEWGCRQLELLWEHGPHPHAFTFRDAFDCYGNPLDLGWRRCARRAT